MPLTYLAPEERVGSEAYTTYYQVFVGTNGPIGPMFEPTPVHQFNVTTCTDGSSGTLLIVEAGRAVPWTKPEDLRYDPDGPLPSLGGLFKDGFCAGFVDGSVRFLTPDLDQETIRSLITRNGGEPVEWMKLK